jgi:DNA-binding NarL/FixJ family response regulator
VPTVRGSVLLVDNQDLVHIGLRVVLQRQEWVTRILGARQGADALLLAARHQPRVALVDLFVGDEFGIEISAAIRREAPAVRVLLTASGRALTQEAARAAGAAGFVPKDRSVWDVLNALRSVASREGPRIRHLAAVPGAFSTAQQEVLELMAQGATNGTIAAALGVSLDTVKHQAVHRAQLLGLLQGPAGVPQLRPEPVAEQPLRRAA